MVRRCVLVFLLFLFMVSAKHKKKHQNTKRDMIATLPDKISQLSSDDIKTGTHFESLGCVFEVAKDDCKTTFLPKQSTCQEMSLPKLFEYFYKDLNLKNITQDFLPMRILQVDRFILDRCVNEVDIETSAKESFEIIKEKLKVTNGKVITSFADKEIIDSPSFDKFSFELSGNVGLGKSSAPISLNKRRGTNDARFTMRVESITAFEFSQVFSNKNLIDNKSPVQAHQFISANIREPSISGTLSLDGSFEIILKGQVTRLATLGKFMFFVVVQKPSDGPTGVAVVADINNVQPTTILSTITGKNLDTLPILRDVMTNVVVEFANEDMVILKDATINAVLGKYIAGDKTVSKGTKLKLTLPPDKITQKVKDPHPIYLQIFISEGLGVFKFQENVVLDLASVTNALIPKIPVTLFSKVFRASPGVQILRFTVDIVTKEIDLKCLAPDEIIMGKDLMAVRNAEFEIKHRQNDTWKFEMHARKKIAGTYMDVTLDKKNDHYKFLGKIDMITTRQLASNFGAKQAAEATLGRIEFLNFVLTDVEVDAEFNEEMKLHFMGTPRFFDYDNSKFEGYVSDFNGTRKMVFGLVLNNLALDDFVWKCYRKKLAQAKWLNQLSASIIISNTDERKTLAFITPELKNKVTAKKGVTFSSSIMIPDDCKGEQLCELAREKMLVATRLFLEGEITADSMTLRAPYKGQGLEIGKSFYLMQSRLRVRVEETCDLNIIGVLTIKDPPLIFEGSIGIDITSELLLTLRLVDSWKQPFALPFVYFNKVQMTATLHPGIKFNKLFMSATMHLGQASNNQQISSNAFISFHPNNDFDNYFFGQMDVFNIADFVRAFNWEFTSMKVIEQSKFPQGVTFGYTTNSKGHYVSHLNMDILPGSGVTFYGKLQVLGMNIPCAINATSQKVVAIATLPAMSVDQGLLFVQQSARDTEGGGRLYVTVTPSGMTVEIRCFAEILGIATNVEIDVTDKGFKFFFYGNLFNLIEANTTAFAPYGTGDFQTAIFQVSSCFASNIADITAESANTITEAGDETAKALKESEERIADSVFLYNKAHGRTVKWSSKLREYEEAVERRSEELDTIVEFMETACVDQCKKVCIGGPSINEHCAKMRGRWVSCPEWEPCKRKIHDVRCLALCKGKKVYRQVEANKKRIVTETLLNSMDTINTILDHTKDFVGKAKDLINTTVMAAQQVQNVTAAGKQAMAAVANFTKQNIIDIHNICFDMPLSKAATGYFALQVDATLGKRKRLSLEIEARLDAAFQRNIAEAISEQLFPGINMVKGDIREAMFTFEEVVRKKDQLSSFVKEYEERERGLEGKVETPEDDRTEEEAARKAVHQSEITRNPDYIRRQLYSRSPPVTIQDDLTLDAFEYDSPWAFSQDDSPFTPSRVSAAGKLAAKDSILTTDIYVYPENDQASEDPCSKTRGLMANYVLVSHTVNSLLEKLRVEKENFAGEARTMITKIDDIEKNILHNCRRDNIEDGRIADALFFIYKLKNGTSKWVHNVEQQILTQDRETLRMWRKSFSDVIKTDKQIDMQRFLDNMKMATEAASRRHSPATKQPAKSPIALSFESATKITGDLLAGEEGTLTSKKSSIDKLREEVMFLKRQIPCTA